MYIILYIYILVGDIPTPLHNIKVNWDDEIPKIGESKNVPNHQSETMCSLSTGNSSRLKLTETVSSEGAMKLALEASSSDTRLGSRQQKLGKKESDSTAGTPDSENLMKVKGTSE